MLKLIGIILINYALPKTPDIRQMTRKRVKVNELKEYKK